jgi:adenylate cyclase
VPDVTQPGPAGDAPPGRLNAEGLALETDTTSDYIAELAEYGAIQPGSDGLYGTDDVPRVRFARALGDAGISSDDLRWAMRNNIVRLDWIAASVWPRSEQIGRTYADFAASLGERAAALPSLYVALGLAEPTPTSSISRDEEEVIANLIELWSMVSDRPEVMLRAARIAGEGVRRIQLATLDWFDESGGSPPPRLRRGLSIDEAMLPGSRVDPVTSALLWWLHTRHFEHELFSRIIGYVERSLADAGRREPRREQQPAIAFVDLAGYTELTVQVGDDRAAEFATGLQTLAEAAATKHGGRVVKLLGDGVMLRFNSTNDAVESVLGLMKAIVDAGLPPAHAGIADGPIVVRDGDVYGHTVNLAARIASHAAAGELLLPAAAHAPVVAHGGVRLQDAGEATLKGLDAPVRLVRVLPTAGWTGR